MNGDETSSPYNLLKNSFYKDTKFLAHDTTNSKLNSFTGFHEPVENPNLVEGSMNIDYVFASGFDISSWSMVTTLTQEGRAISDHRPIIVTAKNIYEGLVQNT